jgi:cysteine sulfinate desulfinase/cysteine desulfurase-like protein
MAMSPGQMNAASGFVASIGEAYAQKAQAIQTQTANLLQANDTLFIQEVQAQQSDLYNMVQIGRKLESSKREALGYKLMGNNIARDMRKANASARARAAASGVAFNEGSAAAVQQENINQAMMDIGVADMNALSALVFGFEDVTAMMESTKTQNMLNEYAAERQATQYRMAGGAARSQGGLLADQALIEGGIQFAQTYPE